MARPKIRSDHDVLAAALTVMHRKGPASITFAALAEVCGLSASTLVQRFKSKPQLIRSALLYAWDLLDRQTDRAIAQSSRTPDGAIDLLVALSGDDGGIDAFADGLLLLREDLRDPALRVRGQAWRDRLARALDDCFAGRPNVPDGIGSLMVAQWQGGLLWWGFDPDPHIQAVVRHHLTRFVALVEGR